MSAPSLRSPGGALPRTGAPSDPRGCKNRSAAFCALCPYAVARTTIPPGPRRQSDGHPPSEERHQPNREYAKGGQLSLSAFVSALPIFPVRLQTSIFGADELNFRVRDGNGWTLIAINTDSLFLEKKSKQKKLQDFLLLTVLFNDKSLYSIWTPLSSPKKQGEKMVTRAGIEPTLAA